jgi:hypothetical protein
VPLAGKIPYDFRKIEGFAKVLNSEMERTKPYNCKQQIDSASPLSTSARHRPGRRSHNHLNLKQMVYLHAPIGSSNTSTRATAIR